MRYLRIEKWDTFQHYKKRNPPWIKLYAWILDNDAFDCMPDASKLLYFCLLPFASRRENKIRVDFNWLQKKLPINDPIIEDTIQPLIANGFITCYQDASKVIAPCKQNATPETEERQRQSRVEGDVKFTLEQVENAGFKAGISDSECKTFFDYYDAQGWVFGGGLAITNLSSALARWRNNGHRFPDAPKPETSRDDQFLRQCEERYGYFVRKGDIKKVSTDETIIYNLKNPKFKAWAVSQRAELGGSQ